MNDVTQLLDAIDRGEPQASDQLLPLVYDELRLLAAQKMSQEAAGQTLQPTALVHEAYMRLVGEPRPWDSRGHFFAAAAEAMRRVLIDHARRKKTEKRGRGQIAAELREEDAFAPTADFDLLALDEALSRLASDDPAKAKLVELRYFAGLSLEEAAEALGISRATASRHWAYARAWLYDALS